MLPASFRPQITVDLIRLGADKDGGYIIAKDSLLAAKSLLSCGLWLDWSFEKDFLRHNRLPLHAYDHTIPFSYRLIYTIKVTVKTLLRRLPLRCLLDFWFRFIDYYLFFTGNRRHFLSKIGEKNLGSTTLRDAIARIESHGLVFLKIDIEGDEYAILNQIIEKADVLCALAIEFHDCHLQRDVIDRFIQTFPLKLVHIHGNNAGNYDAQGDPKCIEMTFARPGPDAIPTPSPLPSPLDQTNLTIPGFPEYPLRFETKPS